MATNEYIQSVLAKAITDISYIQYLEQSTHSDAALLINNGENDLAKGLQPITRFSAFISKVQHNFLWQDFRITFRLMHQYELEIEIFTAYLPLHQQTKKNPKLTIRQKTDNFIDFLKAYLGPKNDQKYKLLCYATTHEDSIRKLKESVGTMKTKLPAATSISSASVVRINGSWHIHQLSLSPLHITELTMPGKKITFSKNKSIYVYWMKARNKGFKILEISKEVKMVMNCIGGSNTVSHIISKVKDRIGENTASDILIFLFKHRMIC